MNQRKKTICLLWLALLLIFGLVLWGLLLDDAGSVPDFAAKNQPPSLSHPFGTDWLGRDMLSRTVRGVTISLAIGAAASVVSAVMGLLIGAAAALLPKWADECICWLIDLVMGVPHIVLLILISFVLGRGLQGVLLAVALTHWPSLARLMRAEVMSLRAEPYITASRRFGKSRVFVLCRHILPHLLPQFLVGLVLLFPHAILHEASITFLGFGLSPEQPAVGIILSESMKYLTAGMWWLAVFPGLLLVVIVMLIDGLGDGLGRLLDPHSAQL